MNVHIFIHNYREAFGQGAPLPLAFWYSDLPAGKTDKINGCFFKGIKQVLEEGITLSLNAENIGCGGGKFHTGFSPMPERVPGFVSLKEKYKKTPEMVTAYFELPEGLLFFATPDRLSGLATWAFFDNNSPDAVAAPFGSGCGSVVTRAVLENRRNGRGTFLGLLDPSVRPYVGADVLSFVIPMSRFREMYHTMRESCLFGTHAWEKVLERINQN